MSNYFDFTALRGQGVGMFLGDDGEGTRDQWIFERFDGNNWVVIQPNNTSTYPQPHAWLHRQGSGAGNPAVALNPQARYLLSFGSAPRLNQSTSNSQFSFGVAVDSNIDAFEPNDTAQTAFALPD
ncbi:hypothetical protein ACQX4E_11950, partial [Corynebacterium diphtheriae]